MTLLESNPTKPWFNLCWDLFAKEYVCLSRDEPLLMVVTTVTTLLVAISCTLLLVPSINLVDPGPLLRIGPSVLIIQDPPYEARTR